MNESRRPGREHPWMVAIIGGAIAAILAAAVIGLWRVATSQGSSSQSSTSSLSTPTPTTTFLATAQQGWMNDCESAGHSPSTCQCELVYFEQNVSYQTFQQDYSATPPGVVPQQLDKAIGACGG